jgi:hypothetical protein
MKIQEAQQILHDNGFLMETITEDIISDILWDNLNTDTNTSMKGIRKVCDFLEYDLGKPIERASVKRIAETIVKLYNLGYESERFHPNHQRKIELKDAMKSAALIKAKAQETMTENFMVEDTETQDDEYNELNRKYDDAVRDTLPNADTLKRKTTNLYHKHLDLEDKIHRASNFNIKNLFYGVEKELQKYYKKVDLEATDYDDENKSQLVRYYFKYNKNSYMLEVMYYDEDGVIVIQIMDEDEVGIERDDFSITTVDKAIKHIVDFVNYNV